MKIALLAMILAFSNFLFGDYLEPANQPAQKTLEQNNSEGKKILRRIIRLSHADAEKAAQLLNQHFQDACLAVGDPGSNSLLVRGDESILKEVDQVIQSMDQTPPSVRIELIRVRITINDKKESKNGKLTLLNIDPKSFRGPTNQVREYLTNLKNEGFSVEQSASGIIAQANHEAKIMVGLQKPFVTGTSDRGFGGGGSNLSYSISYKSLGETTIILPTITVDQKVALKIKSVKSSMLTPLNAIVMSRSANDEEVLAPEFPTSIWSGDLLIPLGHSTVTQCTTTNQNANPALNMVIVSVSSVQTK